ncbi:oxygenase MpaB family protein [Nocardioides sp. TF02-7]|uniref:oxygenase MpaB family protein n=1 Tax=Nocardioides sp. TF02-7 TaxID=2917724 RepID=UPI001F062132|nr:oxygenase MpaB family protein [Nocardioides sp. TF02-7]UMG93920.1 DUF2236 domain-containing protein [Nocardioides sp. TF02-7]
MAKDLWRRRNDALDPETDYVEIVRNLSLHEFTWDITQALSFALFRTYAVPSIGRLLHETQQFERACQKRYDDTALLLEAPVLHGFDSTAGRTGVRRINQMHRMYDIGNDDLRYVLSTFVVVPKRWLDAYGWRPLTDTELRATVRYYRELGRRMGIKDVPATYDGFMALMDDYERRHFAYDEGGRRVADATLRLLTTFYPRPARRAVELFSRCLMEPELLAAFGYDDPGPRARRVARAALRVRARALRHTPSRRRPRTFADLGRMRTYPHGHDLAALGTFPPGAVPPGGCPRVRCGGPPCGRTSTACSHPCGLIAAVAGLPAPATWKHLAVPRTGGIPRAHHHDHPLPHRPAARVGRRPRPRLGARRRLRRRRRGRRRGGDRDRHGRRRRQRHRRGRRWRGR